MAEKQIAPFLKQNLLLNVVSTRIDFYKLDFQIQNSLQGTKGLSLPVCVCLGWYQRTCRCRGNPAIWRTPARSPHDAAPDAKHDPTRKTQWKNHNLLNKNTNHKLQYQNNQTATPLQQNYMQIQVTPSEWYQYLILYQVSNHLISVLLILLNVINLPYLLSGHLHVKVIHHSLATFL